MSSIQNSHQPSFGGILRPVTPKGDAVTKRLVMNFPKEMEELVKKARNNEVYDVLIEEFPSSTGFGGRYDRSASPGFLGNSNEILATIGYATKADAKKSTSYP